MPTYTIDEIQRIAEQAAASGMFRSPQQDRPLTVEQAFMIVLRGTELGLGATTALSGIWFSRGKMILESGTVNALLANKGYAVRIEELTDIQCTACLERSGQLLDHTRTVFTFEEAQKAGLVRDKGGWVTWRQDMLYARCVSRLARRHAPAIFGGAVYAPGEIEEEPSWAAAKTIPDMANAMEDDALSPEEYAQAEERAKVVAAMREAMEVKGYSIAAWSKFLDETRVKLRVAVLEDAPLVNLQRILTQVKHWPDKRQTGMKERSTDSVGNVMEERPLIEEDESVPTF